MLCCSRAFKVRRTKRERKRDTHSHTLLYFQPIRIQNYCVCLLTCVCERSSVPFSLLILKAVSLFEFTRVLLIS